MVDLHTVCCMCGDIGFPDKLFRCTKCHHRFQHSYCSNYYDESSSMAPHGFCDWCLSEERTAKHIGVSSSRKSSSSGKEVAAMNRSTEFYGDKSKQNFSEREESTEKGKNNSTSTTTTGAPSPKPSSRRYKFLKDVMC